MADPSSKKSKDEAVHKAAWPSYKRLLGYALRFRARIAIMILLSFLVAGSLGSIVVAASFTVSIFYEPDLTKVDRTISNVAGYVSSTVENERVSRVVGWSEDDLYEATKTRLYQMRDDRTDAVRMLAVLLVILTFFGAIARYVQEYYAGGIGISVVTQLRTEMYDNLVHVSHDFFDARQSGDIIARFTADCNMVSGGLQNVFTRAIREPIKIAMLLGLAVSVSPRLTAFIIFIIAPTLFLVIGTGNYVRRKVHASLNRVATVTTTLSETVRGVSIIKAYGMEATRRLRMRNDLGVLRRQQKNVLSAQVAVAPATEVVLVFGVALFLVMSDGLVSTGDLGGGALIKLFGGLAMSVEPIRKLAKLGNLVQMSAASADRVFEYIDAKPTVIERAGAKELPSIEHAIEFDNVSFRYGEGEPEVLHELSFTVNKGEVVALVGFSGAGKTTVAKLVPRFYDVTAGAIKIDGVDIRDVTLASLREQIGLVTQHSILFSETILKNISHGTRDASLEAVTHAAQAAHADEFIDEMAEGYESVLAEGGENLSGGQRQRLSIARAVYRDAPILILDEATSSLDSRSEQAIMLALDEFVQGRTTIVIAHRLSTIRKADRIVVMDQGRVIEQGSHAELLAKGGRYKQLYDTQFASGESG